VHQICDWAKYQNRHSSKSIQVTKLSFWLLAKRQFDHSYTF
jgi:hypothetical protein